MPPSNQRKQRSSKLFQCSGYGDCKMVFTRGEHLARHKRKHTGEKPFSCIIPECNKSFSRFDNMMQHTQTHQKESQQSKLQQPQQHQQQFQRQSTVEKSIQPHVHNTKVILHQPSSITTDLHYPSNQARDTTSTNGCLPEHHVGSESPVSLASASVVDSASSDDEDDDDDDDDSDENAQYYHHHVGHTHWMEHPYRQLSIADMCNPMVAHQSLNIDQLTRDEVEVIQAFGKLRQATC